MECLLFIIIKVYKNSSPKKIKKIPPNKSEACDKQKNLKRISIDI